MRFKFVTAGQQIEQVPGFDQVIRGNSLKPLAPVHLKGTRDAANNLLIEWTRRDRFGGSLRSGVGTPLSEQTETYLIDVMSGSTVLHEYRVETGKPQPILWRVFKDAQSRLTIDVDGTITAAPASNVVNGDAIAVGLQTLGGPGDGMIEYATGLVALPTQFGLSRFPQPDQSAPYDSDNSPFMWALNSFNGRDSFPSAAWFDTGIPGYTSEGGSAYDIDDNDHLAIKRVGDRFSFFLNYHPDSAPVFTSKHFMYDNYQPYVYFSANDTVTTKKALRCRIVREKSSFLYLASMQTADGITPGAPVTVRIAQYSAFVGRGYFREATV